MGYFIFNNNKNNYLEIYAYIVLAYIWLCW